MPAAPRSRVATPTDPRDLPGDFAHRREEEVRFGDSDAMGHANNAVYLTYCESARLDYWGAATGRPFPLPIHGRNPSQILAEIRVTYRSPAQPLERLVVETRCVRIGRTSYDLEHRITAGGRLIATAHAVQVGYDYVAERPVPLGDDDVAAIEAFEGRSLRA